MDFDILRREHGCDLTFDENIERLNKKGIEFKAIENIEDFEVDGRKHENVRYLISFPDIFWSPKYGDGASGRSGLSKDEVYPIWTGKFGISSYNLTMEELNSVCRKYSSVSETFRYNDTKNIEFRSDCPCLMLIMDDIRKIAQEKLDRKPKTKERTYFINGEKFTYSVNVEENLSFYKEENHMNFFLYDENKKFMRNIPGFAIYG